MMRPNHNITNAALLAAVQQIEIECGGRLCFALNDLNSRALLTYRAEERCKTASTIKFPMLVHIAMAVHEGQVAWDEKLTLSDAEKVAGSGALTRLTEGLSLSLRDVCVLMTIISDNTATNMLIESFGTAPFNERAQALGLEATTLFRKSYHEDTPESLQYGLGVTTARDMCRLMTHIALRAAEGDAACIEVIEVMKSQFYRDCIPRLLPSDWVYAGKGGSVDAVRNDVGLITAPDGRRFALAVFCQDLPLVLWTADNPGTLAIARLARLLLL
jgi:beta-lactamase class A